jgi:hypothetical protein
MKEKGLAVRGLCFMYASLFAAAAIIFIGYHA